MTGQLPGGSDLNRFSDELDLEQKKSSGAFDPPASHDERAALIAALEELSVSGEELRAQYESLLGAHRSLEMDRERYRILFHFAPEPYLVTDKTGRIEEANSAAAQLLGLSTSVLAGKSIGTYLDAETRETLKARLPTLERTGKSEKWVIAIHSDEGGIVPVEATVSLSKGIGERATLSWLLRDMTERFRAEESMSALNRSLNARVAQRTRELELALQGEQSARKEAEAANRIKTELFARLSHEFRTPLHAVSGYLEILQQNIHGGLTHEQRRDVERIHQAQGHLLALVNMILDFAKLEGGPIELSMAEIPIEETLRRAEALVEPQFAKKAITYTHHRGNPELTVFADREKVQQILLNLLANAMRFTPEGGAVDLDWRIEDDTVLVRIRDTGLGIPDDQLERIFEPFVQLRNPGSVPSGGTGLGLAISRDLARAMGGDVSVRSKVGAGSAFTLSLPLRKHILG